MAILKCKMCGGDLNVAEGVSVCQCEYCGTNQTVPTVDDEKKLTLFARANRLRLGCEFDKAAGVYESIVADFPEEAEAYWGLVLCKYGIEYVDDPKTGKKIPTCHRSAFDSVMDDSNFEMVLEYADTMARGVYREEAKQIEELRRGIIAVSSKEEPYDIFICYKETDDKGERTIDSVIAQDVYTALTEKGYRVFFSRISLEDKLGVEYEPYIFAALHSAKVMLAFGTDYEYYNAVWVKNEWSRFLQLIEKGEKKTLIPCYKGIDAYDMPKEFAKLQAQDMGKVGAWQDLLRGIEKILGVDKTQTVVVGGNTQVAPLLKRAFMFLEDGEWAKADDFCEQVLNLDPECGEAYLGKLMAELKVKNREGLKEGAVPFDEYSNYQKAMRFGDKALQQELRECTEFIVNRNLEYAYNLAVKAMEKAQTESQYGAAQGRFEELGSYKDSEELAHKCVAMAKEAKLTEMYNKALAAMRSAKTEADYKVAAGKFENLFSFGDAKEKVKECREKAEECRHRADAVETERKDRLYNESVADMNAGTVDSLHKAIKGFGYIRDWKDSVQRIEECLRQIERLKQQAIAEAERQEKRRKRKKRLITLAVVLVPLLSIFVFYPLFSYWGGNYTVYIRMYGVKNFTVPNGVTEIEDRAFYHCDTLRSVNIPDSVETIGELAFYKCNSLTTVTVPDSVTTIGNSAFFECENLTSVNIGDGVTTIGDLAFFDCTNLTKVELGDSVTTIGDSAFNGCDQLTEITMSDSVTSIGMKAFCGCQELTEIRIPASVTSIGDDAFDECIALTDIYYGGTIREWSSMQVDLAWATVHCSDGTTNWLIS